MDYILLKGLSFSKNRKERLEVIKNGSKYHYHLLNLASDTDEAIDHFELVQPIIKMEMLECRVKQIKIVSCALTIKKYYLSI